MVEIGIVAIVGLPAAIAGTLWRSQMNEQAEEEEQLTGDENLDLAGRIDNAVRKDPRLSGWEYKIVRAERNIFRDPAVFSKLCAEEELAGWVLLEKLDNRRVRFKRPLALRTLVQAERLAFDPYRTEYGTAIGRRIWIAIAFLAALVVPAYVGFTLVSRSLTNPSVQPSGAPSGSPTGSPSSELSPAGAPTTPATPTTLPAAKPTPSTSSPTPSPASLPTSIPTVTPTPAQELPNP